MATSSLPPFGFSPGQVGPVTMGDGQPARERMGKDCAQVMQDGHAKYQEAVYRGKVFYVCNSAAQALSLASSTTYTGLNLVNPTGSGVNFVLISAIWASTIAPTAIGAVILVTGTAVTTETTTNVANGSLSALVTGTGGSKALVGSACTYAATPVFVRPFLGIPFVSAANNGSAGLQYKDEISGELILTPGNQISFAAVTTAITGIGYFSWEEIPL